MNRILFVFFLLISLISCSQTDKPIEKINYKSVSDLVDSSASTIIERYPTPQGYQRMSDPKDSFQYFLSHFRLKPFGAKVLYYNGAEKANENIYASVLDIDVGKRDLQQCADAVMRLRAEYLYGLKKYESIHFNFTNGFRVDYKKWAEGYRIKLSGNSTTWVKSKGVDYSYKTFREYMDQVFMYAGTLSLSKELKSIPLDSIQIGDVFIKGGSPGHAVIVVDVAVNNTTGKKIFMIAQSYMPAQSIHLLVNQNNGLLSPWYDLSESDRLYTPEWTFEKNSLKRF